MTFVPDRPQRRSPRLQGYDYRQAGAYFVTICVHQHEYLFGEMDAEGQMLLNTYGEITRRSWDDLPQHYAQVELDAFVVMPNHVHGIVVLTDAVVVKRHGLSEVMRGFKTWSARRINEARKVVGAPVWQRSFYDEIIRSEAMLNRVREYIFTNPSQWAVDKENLIKVKPFG